jgi:hypothetical protein
VVINGDGTVTVELADLSAMPAANQVLKDKGIPAEVVNVQPAGSCAPGTELGEPRPARTACSSRRTTTSASSPSGRT